MSLSVKDLELTNEDFAMLMDALEHLPAKNMGNEILSAMMDATLASRSPQQKAEIERKRKTEAENMRKERNDVIEQVRLLQAKIIMMKRLLIQENALKEANDILNK